MARDFTQQDMTGVLFPNSRATKETHPHYTGSMTIKGVKYSIAGWKKENKSGGTRLSISIKPWEDNAVRAPRQEAPGRTMEEDDFGDRIPF